MVSSTKLIKTQRDYISALEQYGTMPGETYVKHLDGAVRELRPVRDKILFAGVFDNRYVLLHQFVKQTQKTPVREIEKAKNRIGRLS